MYATIFVCAFTVALEVLDKPRIATLPTKRDAREHQRLRRRVKDYRTTHIYTPPPLDTPPTSDRNESLLTRFFIYSYCCDNFPMLRLYSLTTRVPVSPLRFTHLHDTRQVDTRKCALEMQRGHWFARALNVDAHICMSTQGIIRDRH